MRQDLEEIKSKQRRDASGAAVFISQKMFIKSICKVQFPHQNVNLFFVLAMIKNELVD